MNGVTFEKIKKEGAHVDALEVFFSGFPRFIPQMSTSFPNISILRIVGQEITSIEHVSTLLNLQELWVVQCKLTVSTFHH